MGVMQLLSLKLIERLICAIPDGDIVLWKELLKVSQDTVSHVYWRFAVHT